MNRLSPVITLCAAVLLFVFAYGFAPWQGNILGDADWFGVPIWVGCLALALGLVAVTIHSARALLRLR